MLARSLDTDVWKQFSGQVAPDKRVRAIRCWTAAEPTQPRLKHVVADIPPTCWFCEDPGVPDTMHVLWHCAGTQASRLRHGLALLEVEAVIPACAYRDSFLCNGWLPAGHEEIVQKRVKDLAVKILLHKLDAFERNFIALEACRRAHV